jgi:hypothetical protein
MVTRVLRVSFVCVLLLAAGSAQSTKLNGELAQPVGGNVTFNYEVTPEGIDETKGAFAAPCHDCTPWSVARGWGTTHPSPVWPA